MPSKLIRAIWLHQFDKIQDRSVAEMKSYWDREIYVKAADGAYLMGDGIDTSPLRVATVEGGVGGPSAWTWESTGWVPWVVPRGISPTMEGSLACALGSKSVILDLEPYRSFWQGDDNDLANYLFALQGKPFAISLDHRRLAGFPTRCFVEEAERILPQCYWTDFQRPWEEVLTDAATVLRQYTPPVEMVLPADSDAKDLNAALQWCRDARFPVSFWLWQGFSAESWEVVNAWRDVEIDADV